MIKPIQRLLTLTLVLLLTVAQPVAIFADSGSDPSTTTPVTTPAADPGSGTPTTTTPSDPTPPSTTTPDPGSGSTTPTTPTAPTTGPQGPTGPQNPTGPAGPTGKIPAYAFNDATQQWVPTNQGSFSWSTTDHLYESPLYSYNAQTGWYHVIPGATLPTAPASTPSSGSDTTPVSGAPVANTALAGTTGNTLSDPAAALAQLLGLSDPSNANTGPGSTNTASASATNTAMLQLLTNALLSNNDTSNATTGNADVSGNTTGGGATTGAATVVDNLLNLLNAAWSWSNGGLSTFAQNLFGDQTGNILLNPTTATGGGGQVGSLPAMTGGTLSANDNTGPDSTNTATDTGNNNVTVVNKPTGSIDNNVNVLAQSGNAGVTGNTQGGDATSGDAAADVNILNLINSAINAGQSFLGVLNIFGNLDGNVLFPQGFLNGVAGQGSATTPATTAGPVATNSDTGPNSTNTASTTQNNTATITNDPTSAFTNNVDSAAQSGTASVADNTQAGSATTGAATTNNNLFNLDNTSLFGDNAVLVLVNVMGTWVGQIMDLPSTDASTGALLTGNATVQNNGTGPGSTNTASSTQNNNLNLTNSPTGTITNNVNAGAISGNANVADNTVGGNATSGSADVATNIANIFGSQLNLTHWFGVLVINVFGNWNGSVESATPNASASSAGQGGGGAQGSGSTPATTSGSHSVFAAVLGGGSGSASTGSANAASAVLASATSNPATSLVAAIHTPSAAVTTATRNTGTMILLAAITLLLAAAFFSLERKLKKS